MDRGKIPEVCAALAWVAYGVCAQTSARDANRCIVRRIEIEGAKTTSPDFLRLQLAGRIGHCYTEQAASADVLTLDRLGVFSSIEIVPRQEEDDVVLVVRVQETFPFTAYPSITATQENGLSVGPAFSGLNIWGRAIKANLSAEFGGATRVGFGIRTPRLLSTPWFHELSYQSGLRDNTLFDFTERSREVGVWTGYQLSPAWSVAGRYGLLSLRADEPGVTLDSSGRDDIDSFEMQLRFDTRNSWSYPVHGWYIELDGIRNGVFSRDGNWWTGHVDARRYQRLADRHTLALFSLLSLQTGRVGQEIPTYMTYGIGGTSTVRGWPQGARFGKHQYLNTVEYRYDLVKVRPRRFFGYHVYWGLHLAVFGDLGTAWTSDGEFTRNFIGGAGYGVRLIIPYVGMVRFDRALGSGLRPAWGLGERAADWRNRIR